MGGFPIEILSQSGQYGDVKNRLRPSPAAQQINEIFLNARDLRRRSMTYERDPLADGRVPPRRLLQRSKPPEKRTTSSGANVVCSVAGKSK